MCVCVYVCMYIKQGSKCSVTCEPRVESGNCARGGMMMLYREGESIILHQRGNMMLATMEDWLLVSYTK